MKALVYSYIGRKLRKRDFKRLWIARLNAATHSLGISYSHFRYLLKTASIDLNLKMLAHILLLDKPTFYDLIKQIS